MPWRVRATQPPNHPARTKERGLGRLRIRATLRVVKQTLREPIDQGSLRRKHDLDRLVDLEPACGVDFGKAGKAPGPWRPLHLETVAAEGSYVELSLAGEGDHALSASLSDLAQLNGRTARILACLLKEFAPRRRERVLVAIHHSFGDLPPALPAPAPKRPSWVDEKYLAASIAPPEQQDP